jgi:hypothetical protein
MNITRDNYEEYFLLYADNELSDSEKTEVLIFLKNNRDLAEEFRSIIRTISKPDVNLEIPDKSFLFRKDSEALINHKNYEEIFLLYHDNELTTDQKMELEKFLLSNRQFKDEFDLIGLARLVPEDSIVFPNKKLLYQKEKTAKVVPALFWRILAAAIFIGFGIWITQLYSNRSKQLPALVSQPILPKKAFPVIKSSPIPEKQTVPAIVQSPSSGGKEINPIKEKMKNPLLARTENSAKLIESLPNTKHADNSEIIFSALQKIDEEISMEVPVIKNLDNKQIASVDNSLQPGNLSQNKMPGNNLKDEPLAVAQTVSYNPEATDHNQNYVFYDLPTDEFKKTRVGGFIKKMQRVIERNNPINRIFSGNDKP